MKTALPFPLAREGRWSILRRSTPSPLPPETDIGLPGLWRAVSHADHHERVFELHDLVLATSPGPALMDDAPDILAQCLGWALATEHGKVPGEWIAPRRSEVESLLPENGLTLVVGNAARQGELLCSSTRLALRFPILAEVPANMPAARRDVLDALVTDAQCHCRLARVGWAGEAQKSCLVVEADLTGAPIVALDPLLSTSLAALRYAAAWLVESAAYLADADVACRAVEFSLKPQTPTPKEYA